MLISRRLVQIFCLCQLLVGVACQSSSLHLPESGTSEPLAVSVEASPETEPSQSSVHHLTNETTIDTTKTCDHGICYDSDAPIRRNHQRVGALYNTCEDLRDEYCLAALDNNACHTNPLFAHAHCPVTCGTCHNRTRLVEESESFDKTNRILVRGEYGNYHYQTATIHSIAGADLGVPQTLAGMEYAQRLQILQRLEQARVYMNVVETDDRYELVRGTCRNEDELCVQWAVAGECDENWDYMSKHCAPLCKSCDELHMAVKCPIDPKAYTAWPQTGDLNGMFERITTHPDFAQYHPQILSQPLDTPDEDGPWVVVLDDFLTSEEADRMMELGHELGYQRSTDVGELLDNGTNTLEESEGRTSMNAWCNDDPCGDDPVTLALQERIEHLTRIPIRHSESFQMLRYEEGQFYHEHHDYIDSDIDRAEGVRILTVFLYLNDEDLEGGGTHFPWLDLTVQPKRGRVLLWPSVLNEEPHHRDARTNHAALVVEKGVKYAINAWYHQRDFQTPREMGC